MKLKKNAHALALDDLVKRLSVKYPNQRFHKNVEYLGPKGTVRGEIDLLRVVSPHTYVMYEIKTGKPKFDHARDQYRRFQHYHPEDSIKGVYVHPTQVRRLR